MRRAAAILLALGLGVACRSGSKVEQCPARVVVAVEYPGASAQEVEQGVVLAVEEAIGSIPGIESVVSAANEGSAEIVAELAKGRDAGAVLVRIKETVDGVHSFPADVERPVVFAPADGRYLEISETLLPGSDRPVVVEVDPRQLRRMGLSLNRVAEAIRMAASTEDIGDAEIELAGGRKIRVGHVASVRLGSPVWSYRGGERVFVSWQRERPADGLGPLKCGGTDVVTVTAAPASDSDDMAQRLASAIAQTDPRAVVIGGDGLEIVAPADGKPEVVATRLAEAVTAIPGVVLTGVSGVPSALWLELHHQDRERLDRAADAALDAARSRSGVVAATPAAAAKPTWDVMIDRVAAAEAGVDVREILQEVRATLHGIEVARLHDGVVRLEIPNAALEDVAFHRADGPPIPLTHIAQITHTAAPTTIFRRDMQRAVPIVLFGPGAAAATGPVIKAAEGAGVTASLHAVR